jgi:hypothetical protein
MASTLTKALSMVAVTVHGFPQGVWAGTVVLARGLLPTFGRRLGGLFPWEYRLFRGQKDALVQQEADCQRESVEGIGP